MVVPGIQIMHTIQEKGTTYTSGNVSPLPAPLQCLLLSSLIYRDVLGLHRGGGAIPVWSSMFSVWHGHDCIRRALCQAKIHPHTLLSLLREARLSS